VRTLFVSPKGGVVFWEGADRHSLTLAGAMRNLAPGDSVVLLPGVYEPGAGIVIDRGGTAAAPIRIVGTPGALIRGQVILPSAADPVDTESDAYLSVSAFWVVGVDHVVFEGLTFEHCWPRAIFLSGARHIVVRGCTGSYGTYLVEAENKSGAFGSVRAAGGILIERCAWTQDPEGLMWRRAILWCQIKRDEPECSCKAGHLMPLRRRYNGALFNGRAIAGDVIVRQCTVRHAFNGVRFEGNVAQPAMNANIQVHDNDFAYIRDNVIEPEKYVTNLWVYRNRIRNSYATFSFDGVGGGFWYFWGNRVWVDDPLPLHAEGHDTGRSFKFDGPEAPDEKLCLSDKERSRSPDMFAYPRFPFYVFHNSIHAVGPYASRGQTRCWHSVNNALHFARPAKNAPLPRYFRDGPSRLTWHPSYRFVGDLSNHPDWPHNPGSGAVIVGGLGTRGRAVFDGRPALDGAWPMRLAPGSPGFGASRAMDMFYADGKMIVIPGGRDVGAVARDGAPFAGPPYMPWPRP
jgi:hypothetical protein